NQTTNAYSRLSGPIAAVRVVPRSGDFDFRTWQDAASTDVHRTISLCRTFPIARPGCGAESAAFLLKGIAIPVEPGHDRIPFHPWRNQTCGTGENAGRIHRSACAMREARSWSASIGKAYISRDGRSASPRRIISVQLKDKSTM